MSNHERPNRIGVMSEVHDTYSQAVSTSPTMRELLADEARTRYEVSLRSLGVDDVGVKKNSEKMFSSNGLVQKIEVVDAASHAVSALHTNKTNGSR